MTFINYMLIFNFLTFITQNISIFAKDLIT